MLRTCLLLCALTLPVAASDLVRSMETVEKSAMAEAKGASAAEKTRIDAQLVEFHKRFNQVLDAMRAFTDDYNESKGYAWPASKAEKLNSAIRTLQKTQLWSHYVPDAKAPRQAK